MAGPSELTFNRLGVDDADEAAAFLNNVWGVHYGTTGAPIFTREYLRWLYGGPDEARHFVLACRLAGQLVGLRALLDRRISSQDRVWTAYLSTHLAIHPDLDRSRRIEVRDQLAQTSSMLTDDSMQSAFRTRDLLVAFFEETKQILIQRTVDRAQADGITMSCSTFHQAVMSPVVLRAWVPEVTLPGTRVRPVEDTDISELAHLFGRVADTQPFALTMSTDGLRHHILGLPSGRSYLVEERGLPSAFTMFYVMEMLKPSGPSRVVVIEFLINGGTLDAARLLLHEALEHARASDARGVVIENPTYLDADMRRVCGITPSTRRMLVTTRSRLRVFDCTAGFLVDVK